MMQHLHTSAHWASSAVVCGVVVCTVLGTGGVLAVAYGTTFLRTMLPLLRVFSCYPTACHFASQFAWSCFVLFCAARMTSY